MKEEEVRGSGKSQKLFPCLVLALSRVNYIIGG